MKNAFVTANPHKGKVPVDYNNPRTEFAWGYYLNADFHHWKDAGEVTGYDHVFCILPKQHVIRDTDGRPALPLKEPAQMQVFFSLIQKLKENNSRLIFIQEGPVWYFQNYDIEDQVGYIHCLNEFDMVLAHDSRSEMWYRGIMRDPGIPIHVLPSTMIMEGRPEPLPYEGRSGTLIGGNLAWWHGGFNSFEIARTTEEKIEAPKMHTFTDKETWIEGLEHLPYMELRQWLSNFRKYKYAVHMMPVVGAGSFALNAVYAGVPCIGSHDIPTQKDLFPSLSFDPDNIYYAKQAMAALSDQTYWEGVVNQSWELFEGSLYHPENWVPYMHEILGQ